MFSYKLPSDLELIEYIKSTPVRSKWSVLSFSIPFFVGIFGILCHFILFYYLKYYANLITYVRTPDGFVELTNHSMHTKLLLTTSFLFTLGVFFTSAIGYSNWRRGKLIKLLVEKNV